MATMKTQEAKSALEAAGYYVREQWGFYSHFLRVRAGPPSPENPTLATIDIEDGLVARAAIDGLIAKVKNA